LNKVLSKPNLAQIITAKSILDGEVIGYSRNGREIFGYHFGTGKVVVSLIAGCHADEPTGSMFLNHLTNYLGLLPKDHPLIELYQWYIVPFANPDGSHNNRNWYQDATQCYDFGLNLLGAVRELPGDDVEFGFQSDSVAALRPENEAIYKFWQQSNQKFSLHVSLHGMQVSYGPWFLIDKDFIHEVSDIIEYCQSDVNQLGYQMHDVDRKGEKGFFRFEPGFGSRPDSGAMRQYFLDRGDKEMASRFHASSMESIRSFNNSCLTLVTEMPLFIVPKTHSGLPWPDPTLTQWAEKMNQWKLDLSRDYKSTEQVTKEAHDQGLSAMPIEDQMDLQWSFIWSGLIHQLLHVDH